MESDETLTKHHNRMPIHMQRISKHEHIVLENINNIRRKQIRISLSSLDRGLHLQQEYVSCGLIEVLPMLLKLIKQTI